MQEVLKRHRKPTTDVNDSNPSRQKHAGALRMQTVIMQLRDSVLRPSLWADLALDSLSVLYDDSPPSTARSVIQKASAPPATGLWLRRAMMNCSCTHYNGTQNNPWDGVRNGKTCFAIQGMA